MLTGGVMLTIVAGCFGEYRDFHPGSVSSKAWFSLVYLIVAGSIIAFTAYTWLIHRESPTKVGTYAYVNPVVGVILGYALGGEASGMRTILGTRCELTSVVLITRTNARQPAPVPVEKVTP
jgi:drug/metabolite transporter (DMT)-like permease